MIQQFFNRLLTVSLGLVLLLIPSPVYGQLPRPQPTAPQALGHLRDLIDVYQLDLDAPTIDLVVSICDSLQTGVINDLRNDLVVLQDKYEASVQAISSQLNFIAESLSQMSADGSSVDLASFHLSRSQTNLLDSASIYANSLAEVAIIDCQRFPAEFIAGIEEVRVRRQLTLVAATEVKESIAEGVAEALRLVQQRLESI